MSDLKPCPFCGEPGSLFASGGHSGAWEGGCSSEGCVANDLVWDISEELVVAAWNRRASPPEDVGRMREALEVIAHGYHDIGPRDFAALARVTAKNALAEKETER